MPRRPLPAILYGIILWAAAAAWIFVASAIPGNGDVRHVPYIAEDLAANLPVLLVWCVLSLWFTHRYLRDIRSDRAWEGYLFGQMLLTVVSSLDFVVFVWLLDRGDAFYGYAMTWVAYAALVFVPWWQGRQRESTMWTEADPLLSWFR